MLITACSSIRQFIREGHQWAVGYGQLSGGSFSLFAKQFYYWGYKTRYLIKTSIPKYPLMDKNGDTINMLATIKHQDKWRRDAADHIYWSDGGMTACWQYEPLVTKYWQLCYSFLSTWQLSYLGPGDGATYWAVITHNTNNKVPYIRYELVPKIIFPPCII